MFNFDPTTSKENGVIGRVLELEGRAPRVVGRGTSSEVTYDVRNISTGTIDFCVDGQGVSTWISSDGSGAKFPSVLYSLAFDASCYRRISLKPGESAPYTEKLVVSVTFPEGPSTLHATIAIKWPKHSVEEVIGTTVPLRVEAAH